MQVDPIKPVLKAPKTKRLKQKKYEPHSNFAFKSNLRRYNKAGGSRLRAAVDALQPPPRWQWHPTASDANATAIALVEQPTTVPAAGPAATAPPLVKVEQSMPVPAAGRPQSAYAVDYGGQTPTAIAPVVTQQTPRSGSGMEVAVVGSGMAAAAATAAAGGSNLPGFRWARWQDLLRTGIEYTPVPVVTPSARPVFDELATRWAVERTATSGMGPHPESSEAGPYTRPIRSST